MAAEILALMRSLGHDRFAVAGHERGALVGHRLALDHPDAIGSLVVLDVLPQLDMWEALAWPFSLWAHHLFLLAQPPDYPERLIGASADMFLDHMLDSWCATPGAIVPAARAAYHEAFRDPATIHAVCEDYRAGASTDVAHDRDAGRKIQAPVLVAWQQPPTKIFRSIRSQCGATRRKTSAGCRSSAGTTFPRSAPTRWLTPSPVTPGRRSQPEDPSVFRS